MSLKILNQIRDLTKNLSTEEKQELVKEIMGALEITPKKTAAKKSPRILGLHAHLGEGWISDDFGDELPDSFWLGSE